MSTNHALILTECQEKNTRRGDGVDFVGFSNFSNCLHLLESQWGVLRNCLQQSKVNTKISACVSVCVCVCVCVCVRERERERERERIERKKERSDTKQLYWFLLQSKSSPVPLHFQVIFTIIKTYYKCSRTQPRAFQMLTHTINILPMLNHNWKRLINVYKQICS